MIRSPQKKFYKKGKAMVLRARDIPPELSPYYYDSAWQDMIFYMGFGRLIIKNLNKGVKADRQAYYDTTSSSLWKNGDLIVHWNSIAIFKDNFIYRLQAVSINVVDLWINGAYQNPREGVCT